MEKYIIDHDYGFGTEFESEESFRNALEKHLKSKIENNADQAERFSTDLDDVRFN